MSKLALKLVGNKYGKLTVVSRAENHISKGGRQSSRFNCLCECGNTKSITSDRLVRGRATSCGCDTYAPIELRQARKLAKQLAQRAKIKAANDAVLALKRVVHQSQIDEDQLFGICKPIAECGKYFLYQDGRLFSMRSLKFLRPDFDHGDYQNTPSGILRMRRTPMYTIVLDNDINALEDRGEVRVSVASLLLKTFDREPNEGERAWRLDWLRNPKKRPKLDELEWVSELEHAERSKVLSELVVLDGETRRRRIRKIEKQALLTLMEQQQVLKQWHDSERCYA